MPCDVRGRGRAVHARALTCACMRRCCACAWPCCACAGAVCRCRRWSLPCVRVPVCVVVDRGWEGVQVGAGGVHGRSLYLGVGVACSFSGRRLLREEPREAQTAASGVATNGSVRRRCRCRGRGVSPSWAWRGQERNASRHQDGGYWRGVDGGGANPSEASCGTAGERRGERTDAACWAGLLCCERA